MIRELMIASTLGMIGIACLVFGLQGYYNPQAPFIALFAQRDVALTASGIGIVLMMLEIRLLVPALRQMAANKRADDGLE